METMQAEGDIAEFQGRTREPEDFSVFFADEHERLFKALYFVTGNRADAAELMQDAFLKLWERWDSLDGIDDPTGYLFRVALNGSRMRMRAARRAAMRVVRSSDSVDPFEEVDMREDVRRMLRTVTPRQRAALILLDLYGYDSKDAARILRIRPSTVRALATQGRAALRNAGGPHE